MRLVLTIKWIAAACLVAAVSTACSSSGSSATGGHSSVSTPVVSSSGSPATGGSSKVDLSSLYKGVFASPQASAPKVSGSKDVWVISCGQASLTCVNISNGAVNAAKALGWTTHVCDGQLNPTVWGGCIRQAIAAKAAAAITEGIDCDTVRAPLQEAKSAHMPVISIVGFDCNDPAAGGGQPLFTANVQLTKELPTVASYYEAVGRAQAEWIIAKTNGHANVLELVQQTAIVTYINKGLEQEFAAACPGCKIVDRIQSSITQTDVAGKVSTALLQHPEANALPVPFDATFILGLQQGLISSGGGSKLEAIGVGGNAPNIVYIRSGQGENATIGTDFPWFGWAAVDTVLRVLAGQNAVPEGCGIQVVDKDHNLPPAGSAFTAPVDYQSAYKKAWSAG